MSYQEAIKLIRARIEKYNLSVWEASIVIDTFADFFSQGDPNFDKQQFVQACEQ